MSFSKSAGVPPKITPLSSEKRALILGSTRPALISLLSLSIISTGAPLVAAMPIHALAVRQPLRDQPCTGVEWAARCIADEQVHWPRWIHLSPGDAYRAQRREAARRQLKKSSTKKFH